MIYDGDCSFCRIWIDYWKQLTGDAVDYSPYQDVAGQYSQITKEQFRSSVQLVKEDGGVVCGAEAVFQSLAYNFRMRWMFWAYKNIPGVSLITEYGYRVVARHRGAAYKIALVLFGKK